MANMSNCWLHSMLVRLGLNWNLWAYKLTSSSSWSFETYTYPVSCQFLFCMFILENWKKICVYKKDLCKNLYNSFTFYNSSVEMTLNTCQQENEWAIFDTIPQGDTTEKQKELLEHDASRRCLCTQFQTVTPSLWSECFEQWLGVGWGGGVRRSGLGRY